MYTVTFTKTNKGDNATQYILGIISKTPEKAAERAKKYWEDNGINLTGFSVDVKDEDE